MYAVEHNAIGRLVLVMEIGPVPIWSFHFVVFYLAKVGVARLAGIVGVAAGSRVTANEVGPSRAKLGREERRHVRADADLVATERGLMHLRGPVVGIEHYIALGVFDNHLPVHTESTMWRHFVGGRNIHNTNSAKEHTLPQG